MQEAADGPQEVFAAAEGRHLLRAEDAGGDRRRADALAVEILRQPVQRVQVAQAALAVLDVGLDLVAALARCAVARIELGHLGVDEGARRACHHLGAEALLELAIELPVAVDQARVEQGRAHGDVGARS